MTTLTFEQMTKAGEAIVAKLGDDGMPLDSAGFRYTLLLVFEEVSEKFPQEQVETFDPSADIPVADRPGGAYVGANRISNAIILPATSRGHMLRVERVEVYDSSNNLTTSSGLNNPIEEWNNILFLNSRSVADGAIEPTFSPVDLTGTMVRVLFESEWDLHLDENGVPDAWPVGFPERIKENVLQGYIAHILLQQAAEAESKALSALTKNEESFVGGQAAQASLERAITELRTILGEDNLLPPLGVAGPYSTEYDFQYDVTALFEASPPFVINDLFALTTEPADLEDFPDVTLPSLTAVYTSLATIRNNIADLGNLLALGNVPALGSLDDIGALANLPGAVSLPDLEDLEDLPSVTALIDHVQTGANSTWSVLTSIRDDLEGNTYLDPNNPDMIAKTVWQRVDQALQDAYQGLKNVYANARGVETGIIPAALEDIDDPPAGVTSTARQYLEAGDNLINQTNLGQNAAQTFPDYANAALAIGRAETEVALAQVQHARAAVEMAVGHTQKINQYIQYSRTLLEQWSNLTNYLVAISRPVVDNNTNIVSENRVEVDKAQVAAQDRATTVSNNQAIASNNQSIAAINRAKVAAREADVQNNQAIAQTNQAMASVGQARASIATAKINAVIEELRARIQEADARIRIAELAVNDRRSARELHGRLQEAKGFLQTQNWQVQAQSYVARVQSVTNTYSSRVAATAQVYTAKLQATSSMLENVVEAMLRRNEISNQYIEIADRYRQEGQARYGIFLQNLERKADAIRRRG